MSEKTQYNPGKIKPLVQIVLSIVRQNRDAVNQPDYVMACLASEVPALKDKSRCPNCEASMTEYIFEFDCLDALLLVEMAREVRNRLNKRMDFTTANQVHVPSLSTTLAIRCRTTQCSKLGLVAKLRNHKGKHVPGVWVITGRGWGAIQGDEVPKRVRVWRGRIEERTDEKTTISEAFRMHREKVEDLIKRHKTPKSDYRQILDGYDPQEWVNFGGLHQGNLL